MSALTDDETLIAYVDGELDETARAAFEARLAADPELAARVDAHRSLNARLSAAFGPIADEPIPANLKALFEQPPAQTAPPPAGEVIAFAPRKKAETPKATLPPMLGKVAALAACLVVGFGAMMLFAPNEGDYRTEGQHLVAQGALERSLSRQLAADSGSTAIGLTFADQSGALCRTFTTSANEGLACHQNGKWRIEALMAKAEQGEFRQAGSSLILQAVDARLSGDVFDAEAERKARDGGWTR